MQRYDVGRGVLREAIRNLERHGFVQVEEGRNGGLRVGTPRPDATVKSAVLYIKFLRIAPRHVLEVGADLEMAAVTQAAVRATQHGAAVLAPLADAIGAFNLPGEPDVPVLMRRYFVALGEASGNRVLSLFMRVLAQPLVVPQAESSVNRHRIQEFHSKLTAMLRALERGDGPLARQYMADTRQIGLLIGPREARLDDLFGAV
jgi:DNA-binding FadR family transcriptional regulator